MIEFEIDGKTIQAQVGEMIIQAADRAGINIPRFCYHPKLSIAANCRMCLIEVEKSKKPLPACATPVAAGMKVLTKSALAIMAQRAVMEFLLINHPLDCPICDQGGECELQDIAMGYGNDVSRYSEAKRAVFDEDLGPLVATDMTRCIHCTRCVRFGEEIAGLRELGVTARGEKARIGTYVKHTMQSELSGNVIDICPVGALTAKPNRYEARAWEIDQHPSVAIHDCVGSNLFLHTRGQEFSPYKPVMRVVPRDNEAINEVWISDRDRFSYEGISSEERITKPRIKQDGMWKDVDWLHALNVSADQLLALKKAYGADQIAAIASPNSTLEECYLLQKCLRGIGCHNIDHRITQVDFGGQESAPYFPNLGLAIADIDNLNSVLLIGSNTYREQPIIANRLRSASMKGCNVSCINPQQIDYRFDMKPNITIASQQLVQTLAGVAKALTELVRDKAPKEATSLLANVTADNHQKSIAKQLLEGERSAVLLGALALQHGDASVLQSLATLIAQLSASTMGELTPGANSAGAWLAGAVPHRGVGGDTIDQPGANVSDMLSTPRKAYVLLNIDPEFDMALAAQTLKALNQADLVIALSPYRSDCLDKYADIILPIAPFVENMGTYINAEGHWQTVTAATTPLGEARPAWKIFRVLGNLFDCSDFNYQSCQDVRHDIEQQLPKNTSQQYQYPLSASLPVSNHELQRLAYWPLYRTDNLVRRAQALQASIQADEGAAHINPKSAAQHKVSDGMMVTVKQADSSITIPVKFNEAIPEHSVMIAMGMKETAGFGASVGNIELHQVTAESAT